MCYISLHRVFEEFGVRPEIPGRIVLGAECGLEKADIEERFVRMHPRVFKCLNCGSVLLGAYPDAAGGDGASCEVVERRCMDVNSEGSFGFIRCIEDHFCRRLGVSPLDLDLNVSSCVLALVIAALDGSSVGGLELGPVSFVDD